MLYDAIDHVILPVSDVEVAAEPFKRLGLTLFPGATHAGRGTRNTGFFVGDEAHCFYVELLGITDRSEATLAQGAAFVDAADQGRGLEAVVLRTERLADVVEGLRSRGAAVAVDEVSGSDGGKICDVARLERPHAAVLELRFVQYAPSHAARYARRAAAGLTSHGFPLKRLDHLAAVAPDLEGATRYWTDVLGIPVHGEVRTPVLIIRQLKVGDAIIELLGPATPESPIAQRPPGLASMTAFEVPDLGAAVAQAQTAGFGPSDPGPGPLPGTRVATIPGAELGGLGLQLLQYV